MGNTRKPKESVEWTELLKDARESECSGPPPDEGWMSREDFRKISGYSESHVSKVTRDLIDAGKMEKKKFKVWTGCRFFPLMYYRRK